MKESHWQRPILGQRGDHEVSDPESHLSPDLQAAIEEGQSVEILIADFRARVENDSDPEAGTKLGELLTYKETLRDEGIDKAA